MDIMIRNTCPKPIYEQITEQIKALILNGTLSEGTALPSMRVLAKELRVSVITTKRAYEELELAGFIVTVPGRGSFIAPKNIELLKEEERKKVEDYLKSAIDTAKQADISLLELQELLTILYGDEG